MSNRQIVIIGAGGHGRVLADIARLRGYESVLFLDDKDAPGLAGSVRDVDSYLRTSDFFVAIGNNAVRKEISTQLLEKNVALVNLIHPAAAVAEDVRFGRGVAVMAGAVINPGARIGDGAIINTSSSVDHDCVIGPYAHISVGAHLAGTVGIGEGAFVCAGAIVINNIDICAGCTIGAGAVVVRNITEPGVYMGIPAQKQSPKEQHGRNFQHE